MAALFVPKDKQGILLRGPLTYGFAPPSYTSKTKSTFCEFAIERCAGNEEIDGQVPKLFGRNHPHPGRVRHIQGLTSDPIFFVEDRTERRPVSPLPGLVTGLQYQPAGSTRYGANTSKGLAAIGVVPITNAWRDELERRTHNAIGRSLGQFPATTGILSHSSTKQFGHLNDDKLLELLCKILQAPSIVACQSWLASCTETEKNIVLNMMRMSAESDFQRSLPQSRPKTSDTIYRYVWSARGKKSSTRSRSKSDSAIRLGTGKSELRNYYDDANVLDSVRQDNVPLVQPDHDSIVKASRHLSSLASRQGLRHSVASGLGTPALSEVQSKLKHAQARQPLRKTSSLSGPTPVNHSAKYPCTKRTRSKSATSTSYGMQIQPLVTVTREELRRGSGSKSAATLRYTSHWGEEK